MGEVKRCKGLPKKDFLRLVDECVSGPIIFEKDVQHIWEVYGNTYTQEEGSIVWRKEVE